ncbi:deoxyribodipyrimidine photo-lyase [Rhizobium sp. BK251]|uniref:cryptochrome/photolyase family protein n=1 Tax=Rhizobium sp. BK251 TaxID=2512125 RepID=UPI001FDEE6F3|nr:deoxyribodipyrimidine photo-lyase [Rhizobium sp. BK251]
MWFRKDLRLHDNLALMEACAGRRPVVPVYIRESAELGTGPLGAAQAWWLHHSLASLKQSLRKLGTDLLLISGDPLSAIESLAKATGADAVVWNRRYDPPGMAIDARVKSALKSRGVAVKSFAGQLLHEPSTLVSGSGTPYRVFAPFWRAIEAGEHVLEPLDSPNAIASAADLCRSEDLGSWNLLSKNPDWAHAFPEVWTPGEAAALEKLADFIDGGLDGYAQGRDFPGKPFTSMLSPHLAMGEIAPARIWHATRGLGSRTGSSDVVQFRKELAWRDFSYHLLFHFPNLPHSNWDDRFDRFAWRSDRSLFRRWTTGMTGYPIVDAGMRQLWQHGWMHNRVRMITASFLAKDLMINWRHGEAWFRDTLVDADAASNAANWQWVAGSGADAAPFFRIFNPVLQGEKFDPNGEYVRRFVPELANLEDRFIHRPFDAPTAALRKAGVTLDRTYPRPVVDHGVAREHALQVYKKMRDNA